MKDGDLEFADTHYLAKLIQFGTKGDRKVASAEWHKRLGRPFPYHPSHENERYEK